MNKRTETSVGFWDGLASIWGAFFVGGVLATILWIFQVGVGQMPSWVVAGTAFLLVVTWGVCAKANSYGGIRIGGAAVMLSVIVSFFYAARLQMEPAAFVIDLAGAVHHMPLLGAIGGLLKALVDVELAKV